jgi:uridylate kinase
VKTATYIISVGGSTVVPDGKVNAPFLKSLKAFVTKRVARGDRFVVVVGGGGTCREYQRGLKSVGRASNNDLDWLGIYTTHLNAQLVRLAFGSLAHPTIATYHRDFHPGTWKRPVVVAPEVLFTVSAVEEAYGSVEAMVEVAKR